MAVRTGPPLVAIILLPIIAGLLTISLVGRFIIYPHMINSAIEDENRQLQRIGATRALEISRQTTSGGQIDIEYLDRIAFQESLDNVLLFDGNGRAIFANDALLQSKHAGQIPAVAAGVRKAMAAGACG